MREPRPSLRTPERRAGEGAEGETPAEAGARDGGAGGTNWNCCLAPDPMRKRPPEEAEFAEVDDDRGGTKTGRGGRPAKLPTGDRGVRSVCVEISLDSGLGAGTGTSTLTGTS